MRPVLARWFFCVTLALSGAALAQDTQDAPDYAAWEGVAVRAEAAISDARASSEAFETLRAEIVVWRERFLRAEGMNSTRIKTLRSQLDALGPVPDGTQPETEAIATRRADLNVQLAEALAPVASADEAFSRTEGLVSEIDSIIRLRQAGALRARGAMPINPALWPEAAGALLSSLRAVGTEVVEAWNSDVQRNRFHAELPLTALYVLIALLLLARGRYTMEYITRLVVEKSTGRAGTLAAFCTSLMQIVVPVLGIFLLVAALLSTGLIGLRGQVLADALPTFGIYLFGARWLGLRLFPRHPGAMAIDAGFAEADARYLRFYATALGLLIGMTLITRRLAGYEDYSDEIAATLYFPILILGGFLLFRTGRILVRSTRPIVGNGKSSAGRRGLNIAGRGTVAAGLAVPVLAAVGFLNGSLFLFNSAVMSLALLGLLIVAQDLVREVYALATRRVSTDVREALLPTLVNLVVVLASLPVFALIWGARVADLTEIWTQFREGFTIGDIQISPTNFLIFAVVFSALYVATRLVQSALRTSVLPKTRIDPGGQTALVSGVGYLGIILSALIAITTAGIDLSSLAIVAGALSIGIGFGLQNIVSNFVSGIILLIERPVAQGDWIEVGGVMGIVKDISVRSTRIETFDRYDVIVPNADFVSSAVKNWTRGNVIGRVKVPVGVAYGTSTRKVSAILKEIATAHPLVTEDPEPGIDFVGFGADSLDFQIRAVIRDVNYSVSVKTELNHRIAERFAEEGIEIPFAQRDVWLRNPEALQSPASPQDPVRAANLGRAHIDEADMGVDPGGVEGEDA